jgi:predicted patatin/cPLA2 family phospholipase
MMLQKGLVLEGGGLRGNYTAGVLDAFLDGKIEFPYVIGVSAGAGMGCSFVSRQRGRNLEILQKYRRDPRYLSIRSYLKTGSIFGMDFVFHRIPNELIPFDYAGFSESPARFVVVCTDCDTGEAVYYEKDPRRSAEDFYRILEASASMPYVAPMVSFEGRKLLDGAVTDALPLARAVEAGFSSNVVVLTNPAGYRKKKESSLFSLMYHGRKKFLQALHDRVEKYNSALTHIEAEEKAGRLIVIRPSRDLGVSRVEKSQEKLIALYELGIRDAQRTLDRIRA